MTTLFGSNLIEVDYAAYLSRHDIVYETPATLGCHGLPIGDGSAGALVWTPPTEIRWDLGACDLWDDGPERPFDPWGKEVEEVATALLAGGVLSITSGLPMFDWAYLSEFSARLALHSAEISLRARTPFSNVQIETWACATPSCIAITYVDELDEAVPRRIDLSRWGSRVFAHWYSTIVRDPSRGLKDTEAGSGEGAIWVKHRSRSHEFAIAARISGMSANHRVINSRTSQFETEATRSAELTVYASIVSSETAPDPLRRAMENIAAAASAGAQALKNGHRKWWAGFWDRSFINIPDSYLENLWYINHYVMGSSSRGAYPPHFINGIWNWNRDFRAWNHYYHWNQEELIWPVWATGHPELAYGYLRMRAAALPLAMESARRAYGKSGAWYSDVFERRGWQAEGVPLYTPGLQIALDMWRYWRNTGDESFLVEIAYPVMRETCRFYLELMEEEADGLFHLPASHPYEHASHYMVRDCLTDMAHVRTAFPATAAVAEHLGDRDFADRLRHVSTHLPEIETIPVPAHYIQKAADGNTFRDGWAKGMPLPSGRILSVGRRVDDGHPVYFRVEREGVGSEPLFPGSDESLVYPSGALGLKDRDSELFEAARTSALADWEEIMGWSVSPIVFARLGMANLGAEALQRHIECFQHFPQGLWNYQATQSGSATDLGVNLTVKDREVDDRKFPFPRQPHTHFGLEPGAVVQTAISEMLLQSHDGVIRVCPAVPADWSGAFALWAEGGFRVSAHIEMGAVEEFAVESYRGEECRLTFPDDRRWLIAEAENGTQVIAHAEGQVVAFPTSAGISYRCACEGFKPPTREVVNGLRNEHAKERGGRWIGIPRMW